MSDKKPITAIIIGAGYRGKDSFGKFAKENPDKLNIVGVAEPNNVKRKEMRDIYQIPKKYTFTTWEEILKEQKFADVAIITTRDNMHTKPTLKALELGYDILLEKPIAQTLDESVKIVKKAEELGRQLQICHEFRYTGFFSKIHEIVQSGKLGQIIKINMEENMSYWHFGHGYVRGIARNTEVAAPLILAKCCHDLDLMHWIIGDKPKKLSSFGSLIHFKPENAPPGATKRCLDGCPHKETCIFYAPILYIDYTPMLNIAREADSKLANIGGWLTIKHKKLTKFMSKFIPRLKLAIEFKDWPISAITEDFSVEGRWKAIKEGPYGRCVYFCDNNVVDNQVINIEFENGITGVFSVQGHAPIEGRYIRIDGTDGMLTGNFKVTGEKIWFYDKLTMKKKLIYHKKIQEQGHDAGDDRLMEEFIERIRTGKVKPFNDARSHLESHFMGFAAEKSRLENIIIDMNKFRKEALGE